MSQAKELLKTVLGASSKTSKTADAAALAAQGVGSEKTVAAAQQVATIDALDAVALQQNNADLKPARQTLAGLTTRYTKAFVYEGLTPLNINQKDIMIDPVSYCDYLRLVELPRMVSVNPDSILFNEQGAATHAGRALAQNEFAIPGSSPSGLSPVQGVNKDIYSALATGQVKGMDPIIGWELVVKPFNLNRGTSRIELNYYASGYTQGSWFPQIAADVALEGTLRSVARIVLLRFGKAYNADFGFKFSPGTAGTDLDALDIFNGTTLVAKQDAYTLKNPGFNQDDALNVTASNAEVWVRPLILSGTTAPAIIQAIQDPGTDLASFVSNMYR